MDKSKAKPKKRKPFFLLKVAFVLFAVYAVYNIFDISTGLRAKQEEIDALKSDIYQLQVQNQELEEAIDSELTYEEIANIAREKLGYVYYGERIYINITGK